MKQRTEFEEISKARGVPVLRLMPLRRENSYGSVPGLDDEELADPRELERQVMLEEWGPVLRLPVRGSKHHLRPHMDESFGVDFGAFGTVDFSRTMPEFDTRLYVADKLQQRLNDILVMLAMVSARLPNAKYKVLKLIERKKLELEHISNEDMRALALYHLRAIRLQKRIARLRELSSEKRVAKRERWLQ